MKDQCPKCGAPCAAIPATPQGEAAAPSEVTDEQVRDGFRDYDKELVARHRTPWQIWRDSSAWTQSALKGMQPGERKDQE